MMRWYRRYETAWELTAAVLTTFTPWTPNQSHNPDEGACLDQFLGKGEL